RPYTVRSSRACHGPFRPGRGGRLEVFLPVRLDRGGLVEFQDYDQCARGAAQPMERASMTLAVTGLTTHLNGRAILDAISLTAEPGWFGVLGANGSGKTTLLKTLCARLDVSGGDIVWQGKNLTADGALRARTFGFAPPLDTLPATVTAGELIRLVTDLRDCAPGQPGEIYDALGLAGLQ